MGFQYIYVIQTREFVASNKNIFKIGKTGQPIQKRHNQYPKGSVLLFVIPCVDCSALERTIINIFKEKFIQRRDLGTEYFEGNLQSMIVEINKLWGASFMSTEEESSVINTIAYSFEPTNTVVINPPTEIRNVWKVVASDDKYKPICVFHNDISEGIVEIENDFFFMLMKKGIIKFDEEYDDEQIQIIKKLSDTQRINIHIENYKMMATDINFIDTHSENLLCHLASDNILLNNAIYAYSSAPIKKINTYDQIPIWIFNSRTKTTQQRVIVSINKLCFDLECLRKALPYCIEFNNDGKYYYINRDYEYISHNTKRLPEESYDGWKREYLFDDSSKPWESKKNLEKFHRRLGVILNENKLLTCTTLDYNLLGYNYRAVESERPTLVTLNADCDYIKQILEEKYVINLSDTAAFIKSRDLIDYIKSRGCKMTDTKIGRELRKIGLIGLNKKISNKTSKIWKGIKHK